MKQCRKKTNVTNRVRTNCHWKNGKVFCIFFAVSHPLFDLDMKQEVKSMIIVCDGCGEHFHDGDDFCSYIDDENGELIEQSALDSEWLKFGDKHYCLDCYELDDEDHYHTKDGKVWDADTEEEIQI